MGNSHNVEADKKKTIHVYHQDTVQLISFYPGTTRDEMIVTIKGCFKLPKESEIAFVDEDGVPVVLSSSMPNETKIYMQLIEKYDQDNDNKKKQNDSDSLEKNLSSNKKPEIKITDGMKEWDPNKKKGGESIIDGNSWKINNNYDWPYSCSTKEGIIIGGTIYKYTVSFNKTSLDEFMYVYTHFGFCFEDEFGILRRNPRYSLMPQFRAMGPRKYDETYKWQIIVDLRDNIEKQGIYFILLPENKCLFFSSFFGKKPSKEIPLFFSVWTKTAMSTIIENVEIGDDIELPKQITFQAKTKLEHHEFGLDDESWAHM